MSTPRTNRVKTFVDGMVDFGGRSPWVVLGVAFAIMVACWSYASHLQIRSDVLELLPRDSPGFQAFERRLERVGGRATLVVLAESPDRSANEKFIDKMRDGVEGMAKARVDCVAACSDNVCRDACGPEMIAFVEAGTKDVRSFFESHKWLYANIDDLKDADSTIERQIAIQSGLVEDLSDDGAASTKKEHALGVDKFKDKAKSQASSRDDFPSGYFASKDGTQIMLRIFSTTSGMGGGKDDVLLANVKKMASDLKPASFHPAMQVGFGGDIANAAAEKESLMSEAVIATSIALALILAGVVWFYRSAWALLLVGFPPIFGVGCAYAFATWRYGFVNVAGAFLGAIIIGNGVNYPIVLYSRYKEFRARGMTPDHARREAVWNAFRAELVGSTVASIAYGSLTVTNFRGFSQFGMIGFIGMLLVWISMIPCLPALIVVSEKVQAKLPKWMRESGAELGDDGSRGPVSRFVGDVTARYPWAFLGTAIVVTVVTAIPLFTFLKDPWEYDFNKLSSKGSQTSGAAQVSQKAEVILSGNMNLAGSLVLVDKAEQVNEVKAKVMANDAADPKGALIDSVTTVNDFLPGSVQDQRAKIEILDRLRDRMTPGVIARLSDEEQKTVREMIPPEGLTPVTGEDLPLLLKRRFQEKNGTVGTVLYIKYKKGISRNDGHNLLRISQSTDGVRLEDGTRVDTASRATVFAEMIRSLERDGPLATFVSFFAVVAVVLLATGSRIGATAVIATLVSAVVWTLGGAALSGERLNFLNFIALPITFGIGSEYPFNIYDRSRLLGGDVTGAVKLHLGAVSLCSYTTVIGYGSLLFADNQALKSFGRLAITGEIACLIGALFVLPSLLHILQRRRGLEAVGANTASTLPTSTTAVGASAVSTPGAADAPHTP